MRRHFHALRMRKEFDVFYGLRATATPHLFETAWGQQLVLLEVGETSAVFYLSHPIVLHAKSEGLLPPSL